MLFMFTFEKVSTKFGFTNSPARLNRIYYLVSPGFVFYSGNNLSAKMFYSKHS